MKGRSGKWLALTIMVEAGRVDVLSEAILQLGAISVDISGARAGTEPEQTLFDETGERPEPDFRASRVTGLFAQHVDIPGIALTAAQAAGMHALPAYTVTEVTDQNWVRVTQAQFKPIRISSRLWIVPTWHTPPDASAINLVLDPGLAFGTGSHPSTRLCLRWLDANIRGGEHVLDYGCGSGILAIAALKLGAASASGLDIDPHSVSVSRANALTNRVEAEFFVPETAPEYKADIVIANILANPLKMLAPVLANATKSGGRLALSGLLERASRAIGRSLRGVVRFGRTG